ncbi:MAG: hypothetical protein GX442_14685 [Candidatus Riflebacteria bacterium]|nr:hypothetical protein [Candidatus Riflebacteria bacterium]
MKRFFKACVFVLVMMVASMTLTGCNIDLAKIGDFITKIAGVISKVAEGIKSFGETLKNNAGTTTAATTGTATGTATVASETTTVTASDTASTATDTVTVGDADDDEEDDDDAGTTTTDAAKTCAANRRVLMAAIECYNMDHSTMMTSLDMSALVSGKYLKETLKCPEGGTYVSSGDLTGATAGVACSKHGASEDQVGDTDADEEEESPGE